MLLYVNYTMCLLQQTTVDLQGCFKRKMGVFYRCGDTFWFCPASCKNVYRNYEVLYSAVKLLTMSSSACLKILHLKVRGCNFLLILRRSNVKLCCFFSVSLARKMYMVLYFLSKFHGHILANAEKKHSSLLQDQEQEV